MRCQTCAGTGRITAKNCFGRGESHVWLTEIGPCPDCLNGEVSCCEGASREEAMLQATDANPNDAG